MIQTLAGRSPALSLSASLSQHTSSARLTEGTAVQPACGDSLFLALLASFLS